MLGQRGLVEYPVDALDQLPDALGHIEGVVASLFVDEGSLSKSIQEVLK